MSSNFSLAHLLKKISRCEGLSRYEAEFVETTYETTRSSFVALLSQCDELEKTAIALSEAECRVEAHRMEFDYRLAVRLAAKSDQDGCDGFAGTGAPVADQAALVRKVCLACFYENQIENILASRDLPLSSEFLSALTDLEAALIHLNDVASSEKIRPVRAWAN